MKTHELMQTLLALDDSPKAIEARRRIKEIEDNWNKAMRREAIVFWTMACITILLLALIPFYL